MTFSVECYVQGDHGGQTLHCVDFIFEVPQSCPTAMPLLTTLQLPGPNQADSGTTRLRST